MTTSDAAPDYRLIDCGYGRRLERVGRLIVDRPAPVADDPPRAAPSVWSTADGRFERGARVGWHWRAGSPASAWTVEIDGSTFEVRPASGGQVGLFPEQRPMWHWVAGQIGRAVEGGVDVPEVLNLFAFTGAATLAATRAGARVAHVDASRAAVGWARRNAGLSGLADRPIRWLVDDAEVFARRELRRGRAYDGVILDPPTYGHGPGGRTWNVRDGLAGLLDLVARLVAERRGFVLLTVHTTDVGPDLLRTALVDAVERRCEAGLLGLVAESGARLPLGAYARVPWGVG